MDATADQLKFCLQSQISELNMLQSIYYNPGELKISDPSVEADINEYLAGNLTELNSKLEYTIRQELMKSTVDISFEIPHQYPLAKPPHITLRSPIFTKAIEAKLRTDLNEFITTVDTSEVYVYEIVTWILDNAEKLLQTSSKSDETKSSQTQNVTMERLWIYSHHIKSKTKRQNILKLAKDLDLTGFLRSGKPGIICVEGLQSGTQEFWKIVRTWNWHKITLKSSETKMKCLTKLDTFRRFPEFREEMFTDIGVEDGDDKEVVMDMSLFMKFLELHKCSYIKKELFGFD